MSQQEYHSRFDSRAFIHLWAKFGWGFVMVAVLMGMALFLGNLLTPLVLAFFLAYILDPVIDRFESLGIHRTMGIILFLTMAILTVVLLSLLLVPIINVQVQQFSDALPGYLERMQRFIVKTVLPAIEKTFRRDMPGSWAQLVREFPGYLNSLWPSLLDSVSSTINTVLMSTRWLFTFFLTIILLPVFTFYLLKDYDRIRYAVMSLFPRATYSYWTNYFSEINTELASVIRGQITVCLILGTLYAIGLSLIGLPLGVVIGLLTGILAFIPYVGFVIGFFLALLMALFAWDGPGLLFGVLITYGLVQSLDAVAITPRILGDRLHVSPLIIMLALLVGGRFAGFIGVLLAVPVTAIIKVMLRHIIVAYRGSAIYLGHAPEPEAGLQPPSEAPAPPETLQEYPADKEQSPT